MGKVVQFDGPGTTARSSRGRRRRGRGDKTALVLGGGGFTGGVYEIGALRALDLLSVNRTVNQFDVYVGTSAGAFVAGMVANGITPESIVRPLEMSLASIIEADYADLTGPEAEGMPEFKSQEGLDVYIGKLESDMREAAKRFEFEKAAKLRDTIRELRTKEFLFA